MIDGPFAETKEVIAGHWIWPANSKRRRSSTSSGAPHSMEGESKIEIRQVFEAVDFGGVHARVRVQKELIRGPCRARHPQLTAEFRLPSVTPRVMLTAWDVEAWPLQAPMSDD
jgi:hypothetical protein